jgi:hypothetical protein
MDGDEMPDLNAGKVYSGDIHVPQVIGKIEYVGSPYHVHFGDNFKPRCLVIDKKRKAYDLHFETISRRTIKVGSLAALKRYDLGKEDQVKLTIELEESDAHQWNRIRREAVAWVRDQGAQLHGVKLVSARSTASLTLDKQRSRSSTPSDAVLRFAASQELWGEVLDLGLEIVEK